jgi:hypothetical protein
MTAESEDLARSVSAVYWESLHMAKGGIAAALSCCGSGKYALPET